LSPEKGIDELLNSMSLLDGCALWLVGDGPDRRKYEDLAKKLNVPVQFWGYQHREALHSVYTMADCFVCPSLTETFGQTVNEALASNVRVALPTVKVFAEAFSEYLPKDAFWEPLNRQSMATAIQLQLQRHDEGSTIGKPDAKQLRSWDDACEALLQEYTKAEATAQMHHQNTRLRKRTMIVLPIWFLFTIFLANYIYVLALIRSLLGGLSLRYYLKTMFNQLFAHKDRM
jgi:glycosyltransferase involved in cell wall biosynthesis